MESRSKQAARKFWETMPLFMRAMANHSRQSVHNLAPVHFRVLRMLSHTDCNLSQLAEHQGVTLPSISATAQTLVERGWLERKRSAKDRRMVNLAVTPEGLLVLGQEYDRMLDWVAEQLEGLSDEELETVSMSMDILQKAFEMGPESPAKMELESSEAMETI